MFTLKFYKHINDGELVYDAICTPHYEVYARANGSKTVTAYPDTIKENGVERHIVGDGCKLVYGNGEYNVCYVENMSGKTIDTIRPGMLFANTEI